MGLEILLRGIKGKVILLDGPHLGPNYCVVELEQPNEHGNKIIEILKDEFRTIECAK